MSLNLLWIAIITLLVFLEMVLSFGNKFGRIMGFLMILLGGVILLDGT